LDKATSSEIGGALHNVNVREKIEWAIRNRQARHREHWTHMTQNETNKTKSTKQLT